MNRKGFLLFHILLGFLGVYVNDFSTIYGVSVFLFAFFQVLRTSNKTGWAHLGAVYIIGMEVWLRMTKASLFWEFGKIASITLLALGLIAQRSLFKKPVFLLLIALLIPSIFLAGNLDFDTFRQSLTFQLGGLILLSFSTIYFYKRPFDVKRFQQILLFFIGPIIATIIQITLKSPSLSNIAFQLGSNFEESGGFGPNQVSTILGIGIICIGINFLFRMPPFFSKPVDLALLTLFIFRGLLTFSRGGLVTAVISLFITYILLQYEKGFSLRRIFTPVILAALVVFSFIIVNNITGGALLDRYKGETYSTKLGYEDLSISKVTTGRFDIIMSDLNMWRENPILGVGVGVSNLLRPGFGVENISHTEQSRLLAEHGILGLIVIFIIVFTFIKNFQKRKGIQRAILILFFLVSFLTMFHSATRLAITGFIYGMGFLYLIFPNEDNSIYRKQTFKQRIFTHNY